MKAAPLGIALKIVAGLLLLVAVVRVSLAFITSLNVSHASSNSGYAVSFNLHADWITLSFAAFGVLLWILSSRIRSNDA